MAPTHGVYAVRHALLSLLVCQAYRATPAPRAGSGAFTTEFRGPGPPCTYCVDRRSTYTTRLTSLGVHSVSLETIVRSMYSYRVSHRHASPFGGGIPAMKPSRARFRCVLSVASLALSVAVLPEAVPLGA